MPISVSCSDAAHRVHPLAGLGVNLGFGDVSCLHQVLLTAASRGEDWGKQTTPLLCSLSLCSGSLSSLKEYESSRQLHNVPVMATIDGLQRLFSTSWTPAVLLRSVGLQLFGALSPIKVAAMAALNLLLPVRSMEEGYAFEYCQKTRLFVSCLSKIATI